MTREPERYLPNQPPEDRDGWHRFAEEDAAAGFVLTDDFERFNQRNDMFNRAFWDPEIRGDHTRDFFNSYRVDVRNFEEKPNDLPSGLTHVIVLGHGMDHDPVQTYPSALAGAAVGLGYSSEAVTAQQLAQYIRNLGYQAVASMNDTALVIPLAIKAGLGEYGRNQMVITPEFGPRVRFSKIFTDMPLDTDRPKRFGVEAFCNVCSRCADACPPKALPYGPPDDTPPNRSSIRGVRKWTADCEKCFGYWAKLKSDCAICMRVCPYNRDYRRIGARLFRRLAGTRLRRIVLWLDTRFGHGSRQRPRAWWSALTAKSPPAGG